MNQLMASQSWGSVMEKNRLLQECSIVLPEDLETWNLFQLTGIRWDNASKRQAANWGPLAMASSPLFADKQTVF